MIKSKKEKVKKIFPLNLFLDGIKSLKDFWKTLAEFLVLIILVASIVHIIKIIQLSGWLFFLSWNQILNDSIIFWFILLLCFFSFYLGLYIGIKKIFSKLIKYERRLFFISIIIFIIILFFLIIKFPNLNDYIITLLSSICFFFILGFVSWIGYDIEKRSKFFKLKFYLPFVLLVIFVIFIMFFIRNPYDSLYTKIDNEEIKIEYMTDQYLFSSGSVYNKDWAIKFYNKK